MRSNVGILLGGILWPLVLAAGFIMAFLLIGLFFSWPLMWGAISAEGTDSFGALSHSYSYAYQRPLQYLFYAIIAAVIGVFGWLLVSVFAVWIVQLSYWGISWGSGHEVVRDVVAGTTSDSWLFNTGSGLIGFWNHCVLTFATAFMFSYLWTSSTIVYFLLRRLVDATEVDEVFMPEENELHGLPPLKTGADGVAQVAEEPDQGG